jgi:hypothetical protein
MQKKKLLCFECFHEFSPHEVWFRCSNTERGGTSGCPLEADSKRPDETLPHAFALHGYWRALLSLFKTPMQCPCPRCKAISKKRICAHCHRTFETGRGQIDEHIIAVVGNGRAGKSHYFTVLVDRVIQGAIGRGFMAHIEPADLETKKLYNTEYRRYLFVERQVIPPTLDDKERKHRRLVFRLSLQKGADPKKRVHVFLVFYDIAGEKLGDIEKDPTNATRYLHNSSGIIYLANPRDATEFGKYLEGGLLPEPAGVDDVYSGIEKELRRNKMWELPKKLPIPLAVCISQFDRFSAKREAAGLREDLFDASKSPICDGSIDGQNLDNESNTIKDFMEGNYGSPGNLVRAAVDNFSVVRFFAVSALGASPTGEDQKVEEVRPCRVEAPFFWVLHTLKLFDGAKR